MKLTVLVALLLSSVSAFASRAEMQTLIQLSRGNFYDCRVPEGYTGKKVVNLRPEAGLKSFITRQTKKKMIDWKDFVMTSGEYRGTEAELAAIAADPAGRLEVTALLEVDEACAFYKDGRLIGYFVDITDYVQSAIYQDGAWFDVFTDEKFNIVQFSAESA